MPAIDLELLPRVIHQNFSAQTDLFPQLPVSMAAFLTPLDPLDAWHLFRKRDAGSWHAAHFRFFTSNHTRPVAAKIKTTMISHDIEAF